MSENVEMSGNPHGVGLQVRTPGRYAMDVAIEILKFLDQKTGISVKNTGWKNGFGLDVCAWTPILFGNLVAELQTDGEELQIRRASGPHSEFEALFEMVSEFLSEKNAQKGKFTRTPKSAAPRASSLCFLAPMICNVRRH